MEKTSDEQLKKEMLFDCFGRYAVLRDVIDQNRKAGEKFQILDVGGRGNPMKLFLPEDDVFYLDPLVDTKDSNYIEGDGCAMPLEDESFDWVVSTDVFEHIPEEKREDFLKENVRVAKLGMLLAAPFDSPEVRQAEINVNENFRIISGGEDHMWLKEHIANGLPKEKQVEDFAKENNLEFSRFSNNRLFLWEALYGMTFIAQNNSSESVRKEFKDFNSFYNTEVFPFDSSDPAYRKIFFFKKSGDLKDPDIREKKIDDSLFLLTIKKANDVLCKIEVENKEIIQQKERIISQKENELVAITSSLRWLIPNYFYKIYLNRMKPYIPKYLFKIVNPFFSYAVNLKNSSSHAGKRKKDRAIKEENERQVQKVLETRFEETKKIEFEIFENPKISVVIPAYNKWQFTYNCLKSLKKNTEGIEYEVIVVDNGSSDETKALLERMKNVKCVRNSVNKGFAKACNQGAKESNGEYILFLNNDIIATKGWLSTLAEELDSNKKASIAGSKLLFPAGVIQHAGVGFAKDKIPFHLFHKSEKDDPRTNERKLFDAVTAACLLIRRNDFFAVGGFDEAYRNGLEDVDLCLKIRERGKEIVYRPDSVLYHFESMSDGRYEHHQKNINLFLNKWGNRIVPGERGFVDKNY